MRAGWCLVVWMAALQCAAAETLRLIDGFETLDEMFADVGEFVGVSRDVQPLVGSVT